MMHKTYTHARALLMEVIQIIDLDVAISGGRKSPEQTKKLRQSKRRFVTAH
jgi:hypothetical protein